MEDDRRAWLRLAGANLALIVALLHLGLGLVNWLRYLSGGVLVPTDIRWPLFVISGVAMLAGLALAREPRYRTPLYAGGMLLMVVYIVGYFGWHVGGHRRLILFGPSTHHDVPLLPFLVDHLFAGVIEFVAIVTEVALFVVLGYLIYAELNHGSPTEV
mgnify:CR=1 FL=1